MLLSHHAIRAAEMHQAAVKRILRYLRGTINLGILYKKEKMNYRLEGWNDSYYAGDINDRKSTSGYVFKLGTGALSWSSKKQPIVTLSTTEAEFVLLLHVPVKPYR